MSGATAVGGTRGRPRLAETDRAIHASARELLAEEGYVDLTIEGVARRAGVGKPTVYRRYDSKASLVAASLLEVLEGVNPEPPDTGDPAADAKRLLGNLVAALDTPFGRALAEIVSPAARDPQLSQLFAAAVDDRRVLIRTVMRRAADAGRLAVADVEVAIDVVLGAIYFRHLITREPLDATFVAQTVDAVVRPRGEHGSAGS